MNGLPQNGGDDHTSQIPSATVQSGGKENEIFKKSNEKVQYWLRTTTISDSESLSSPTSLFFVPNNPFDPTYSQNAHDPMQQQYQQQQQQNEYYSCDNSTQQLLDSETLGNETEEKLVLCNPNDNQLGELLQILKENERQNAEINALRLERERLELEEAKIRLSLAEEEASRVNNNDNNNLCHLQILGS
uniref:Uncharacterized protein n=1 Tax=Panagrolaimus sp. ES5 TaxID=591445 RepID=A0AC34GVC0_9BILA